MTKEEVLQGQLAAATEEADQRLEEEAGQLEHRNRVADLAELSFVTLQDRFPALPQGKVKTLDNSRSIVSNIFCWTG